MNFVDEEVQKAIVPWKEVIDAKGNVVMGETLVDLQKDPCSYEECNLGNFYCDATIYSVGC